MVVPRSAVTTIVDMRRAPMVSWAGSMFVWWDFVDLSGRVNHFLFVNRVLL